jgi:ElaB/YqjD/DUF883 family membrane-anchored ribosome-binding protein
MPRTRTIQARFKEGIENTKEKFEDVEDSAVRYIKKNPIKSVIIALGIGAIIGAGIALGVEAARPRKSFWERYTPFN